tara:strand:+ start:353 stop:1207 length:855 start_codon:yes stop_codon:yes gene_type:complete
MEKKSTEFITADLLDEDKPIANQKFCCLSFLSPEKILKNKDIYFFNEFIKKYDVNKNVETFSSFLGFLSYKYKLDSTQLQDDFKEFFDAEKEKITYTTIFNDYNNFIDTSGDKLQQQFDIDNHFKTNVRGVKVRGSYNTQQEAEMKAKQIRELDPAHDVYVGQVGLWMPFDPDAYKTGKIEYMENELNELMHNKNINDENAKNEFDDRIKESKKKAIEDNVKKAQESGNVLSQVFDDETGELHNLRKVDYDSIPDDQVRTDNERPMPNSVDVKNEILKKFNGNN